MRDPQGVLLAVLAALLNDVVTPFNSGGKRAYYYTLEGKSQLN
jgi:hypothetical protein